MEHSVKDILADDFWIMPATPEYIDEGVPYITSKNIKNGIIDFTKVNYISQDAYENISKNRPILVGDILISMIGTLGETAEVKESDGSFYGQNMFLVRLDESKINKRYFLNFFKSNCVKRALEGKQNQSTQKYLKANHIEDLIIPVPALDEQKLIAKQLDKLAGIIALRNEELKYLDNFIKARFVELFGDLKPTTTIARYISELRGGKSLAGTEECKNKVLKTGAATFGWFDPEQHKYLPTDYEPLPEHKVETGDVIISRMNTPELVGACSYVFEAPEDMYYPDRLWKVIPQAETNPIFLWQLLWDREIRRQIKEKSGGTSGTMHNISKPKLLEIKCIDAPIELQEQFADFVKQVDKSKVVA